MGAWPANSFSSESKKSQQDIKKALAETSRLQKKLKKGFISYFLELQNNCLGVWGGKLRSTGGTSETEGLVVSIRNGRSHVGLRKCWGGLWDAWKSTGHKYKEFCGQPLPVTFNTFSLLNGGLNWFPSQIVRDGFQMSLNVICLFSYVKGEWDFQKPVRVSYAWKLLPWFLERWALNFQNNWGPSTNKHVFAYFRRMARFPEIIFINHEQKIICITVYV